MKDQGCGSSLPGWFARWCPDSSSWKTCQGSLFQGWAEYSATWPQAGMMRNGFALALTRRVPRTSVTGPSSSPIVATPTAKANQLCPSMLAKHPGCRHLAQYPTPSATEYGTSGNGAGNNTASRGRPSLQTMARKGLYPTPTARDQHTAAKVTRGANSGRGGVPLVLAVQGKDAHGRKLYPTPTVALADGGQISRGGERKGELLLAGRAQAEAAIAGGTGQARGQLNPEWVCWLMGFPIGWLDLER